MVLHLRRRAGMPMSRMQASAAPPSVCHGNPWCSGLYSKALVAAVVEMVRVAVPELVPVMLTGVVEPKLKVGGYCAPAGLEVMAAVSATLPVKPPKGVTEIVEVLPEVAPGATEAAVPLTVKQAVHGAITVIGAVPLALV